MTTPDKEEMPTEDRTPVLPVRLEQPWAGFSCLHIGSFKIGIAVTDEDGTQDPDAAGTALEAWVTACNAYEPMRKALEKVMVGGNHLGLIIGVDHPPHTASHEEARTHYADAIWTYEAWCCWKTIMEARPALSTLPVIDRQTSDDVGILRALLEEELVWHEERDKSLSKQPQSNQVVWRRAEHQERIDVIRAALKGPASEAGKLSTDEVTS